LPFALFPFHFGPSSLRPDAACYATAVVESLKMSPNKDSRERELIDHTQAFENTSTNVAAAQMRNALTNLAETVEDPKEKKVSLIKMQ
jgi:UTP--glucose-1-phosphate uridylyltransferase